MPSALVDDDFRADLDEIRTLGGELGLRVFTVTVRRRTWSGGPLGRGPGAPGATKVDVDTVLTNQAADGTSQAVMVRQLSRQDVFASGGQLSTRDLRVGPITPAFAASILPAGGFDDTKLDPVPNGSTSEIVWILSSPTGTYGIPAGGVICEKKGEEATALHYYVILRSTGRAPTPPISGTSPTLTSVTPNAALVLGSGQPVVIAGTGFQFGALVTFGGLPALGVIVNSASSISCIAPPSGVAGAVAVAVRNPDGTSVVASGAFTYLARSGTVAVVTSANSPYTAQPTDDLIVIDESNGLLATVKFELVPLVDTPHTVIWFKWASGSPPPLIDGNGKQLTPWSQGTQTSGALTSTTNISVQGASGKWVYDGTEWLLVG